MEGGLTITRPNHAGEDGFINITVRDRSSRTNFLTVEVSLANFTQAITGLAETDCQIEVRNLDRVGLKKESKALEFSTPEGSGYRNKEMAFKEALRLCPEGWSVNNYFNSQDSFFTKDGREWARTSIVRWIKGE